MPFLIRHRHPRGSLLWIWLRCSSPRGVPFREAHEAVGRLVTRISQSGGELADATPEDLEAAHDDFRPEDLKAVGVTLSMQSRATPGSGSSESVIDQITAIAAALSRES